MKDLKDRFDVLATAAEGATDSFKSLDGPVAGFVEDVTRLADAVEEARKRMLPKEEKSSNGGRGTSVSLGGAAGEVGGLTEALGQLPQLAGLVGAQMQAAMTSAVAPVVQVGQTIARMVDQVGGTMTQLARNINEHMRFKVAEESLNRLRRQLSSGISAASQKAAQDMTRLDAVMAKFGPTALTALNATQGFLRLRTWLKTAGDVARNTMSAISGINFNRPVASANQFKLSITNINRTVGQARAGVAAFGKSALAAFGVFGLVYKGVQFIKDGVAGASSLNETVNKMEAILGNASPAAKAFAENLSNEFGLVKKDVMDAEAAFGGLGKGLGKLSGEKLSEFSNRFTQLSADLSSFADLDMAEATKALQIGLAGNQSDRLREMGVILLDTAVKARAVKEGFAKSTEEVSESAKVMARAAIISDRLKDASGDLARTANSPANQFRKLKGTAQNLAVTIGQSLMPIVTKIGGALTAGLSAATRLWQDNQGVVTAFQESAFLAFETVKIAVGDAITAVRNLPATFDAVFGSGTSDMISAFADSIVNNIGAAITGVGSFLRNMPDYFNIAALQSVRWVHILSTNLANFGEWFANNWTKMLRDGLNFLTRAFLDFSTLLSRLGVAVGKFLMDPSKGFQFDWTPMLKGFEATTAKLPDLVKPELGEVNKEIEAAWDRIAKKDSAVRAKVKTDVEKANTPAPQMKANPNQAAGNEDDDPEKKKKKEKRVETSGALTLGSKEAASAIAKYRSGVTDKLVEIAKQQLEEAKKANANRQMKREWRANPLSVLFDPH